MDEKEIDFNAELGLADDFELPAMESGETNEENAGTEGNEPGEQGEQKPDEKPPEPPEQQPSAIEQRLAAIERENAELREQAKQRPADPEVERLQAEAFQQKFQSEVERRYIAKHGAFADADDVGVTPEQKAAERRNLMSIAGELQQQIVNNRAELERQAALEQQEQSKFQGVQQDFNDWYGSESKDPAVFKAVADKSDELIGKLPERTRSIVQGAITRLQSGKYSDADLYVIQNEWSRAKHALNISSGKAVTNVVNLPKTSGLPAGGGGKPASVDVENVAQSVAALL